MHVLGAQDSGLLTQCDPKRKVRQKWERILAGAGGGLAGGSGGNGTAGGGGGDAAGPAGGDAGGDAGGEAGGDWARA